MKSISETVASATEENKLTAKLSYTGLKSIFCVCASHLVKNPDFSVDGGPGDPMAVVMEEDPLFFGVASQRRAQLLHFVHGGVQTLLVASLKRRGETGVSLFCILRRETVKLRFSSFWEILVLFCFF